MSESLKTVDSFGREIGAAPRDICHNGKSFIRHAVVHLHVIRGGSELLLQLRSRAKHIQPGKWDTAVGGHVGANEAIYAALCRETSEELGVSLVAAAKIGAYEFRSEVECEWVEVFVMHVPTDFQLSVHNQEVERVDFFNSVQLAQMISVNATTPNFASEYQMLIKPLLTPPYD